MYAGLGEGKE
jgi:hypothetical protein